MSITFTADQLNAACNMARSDYRRDVVPRIIKEEMFKRCEVQGHQWENACNVLFQVYQVCIWCNLVKGF